MAVKLTPIVARPPRGRAGTYGLRVDLTF